MNTLTAQSGEAYEFAMDAALCTCRECLDWIKPPPELSAGQNDGT